MWQELNREDTTTSLHYLLRAGQILITTKSLDKTSGMAQPLQTRRNTECLWRSRDLPICARQHTKAYLTLCWHYHRDDAPSTTEIHPPNVDQGSFLAWGPPAEATLTGGGTLCSGADLPSPGSLLTLVNAYYHEQEEENSPIFSKFYFPPLEQL